MGARISVLEDAPESLAALTKCLVGITFRSPCAVFSPLEPRAMFGALEQLSAAVLAAHPRFAARARGPRAAVSQGPKPVGRAAKKALGCDPFGAPVTQVHTKARLYAGISDYPPDADLRNLLEKYT